MSAGPETGAGFARKAEILHAHGESAAALQLLTAGVRRSPGDVIALLVLARVCRDTGRNDEACEWLEAALRLDPECPAALFHLSELLGKSGTEPAQAAAYRSRLKAQEPWGPSNTIETDTVPPPSQNPDEDILTAYRPEPIVLRRDPAPSVPSPFVFPVREEEEEPEIEENSAPHVATVTLAEIYLQQGLKEQAIQIYRQLLEQQPGDDSVRKRLQEIEGS